MIYEKDKYKVDVLNDEIIVVIKPDVKECKIDSAKLESSFKGQ